MPSVENTPAGAMSAPARSPRWAWAAGMAIAIVALAWMGLTGLRLTRTLSPTVDEPGHLSAGMGDLRDDYRQSTNGNLFFSQKWAAWPLVLRGVKLPDPALQERVKWQPNLLGAALLYGNGADPLRLLAPARRMTLLLCLLGGLIVCGWASWLAGPWAGALAALLYATSPVILANGVLVTTDTSTAFWYLTSVLSYAILLRTPNVFSAALSGFCAAMLLVTKFSFPAWVLAAGLLLAWQGWRHRASLRLPVLLRCHGVAVIVGWLTVWTFFGWSYRPGGFVYVPDDFVPANAVGHAVLALKKLHAVPEPFLRDALSLQGTMQLRSGYLFGEFKVGGHFWYFPVAFVTKSTVALLAALLAGLVVWWRNKKTGYQSSAWLAPLVAGILGYTLPALGTSLNIGVRHILPIFVLLTIAGGVVLARLLRFGPVARGVVLAIALIAVAEGVSASRQPLAWFNAPAGGPMNGYRIMIDSSLDWGADLPAFNAWVDKLRTTDPATPVYGSIMGPAAVTYAGMKATDMENAFMEGTIRPGYFVFSATLLLGGPERGDQAGTANREQGWNEFVAPLWKGAQLPRAVAQVAVGRIAAACRKRTPTERIGPVYFVYHLDEAALEAVLGPKL